MILSARNNCVAMEGVAESFKDSATAPLSAIADAFEELAKLINSVELNGSQLRLDTFCDSCSLVSILFGCLGLAFKFAELEYVSKVCFFLFQAFDFFLLYFCLFNGLCQIKWFLFWWSTNLGRYNSRTHYMNWVIVNENLKGIFITFLLILDLYVSVGVHEFPKFIRRTLSWNSWDDMLHLIFSYWWLFLSGWLVFV